MKFFEVRTAFFRPVWRRVLATGLCLGWALFEFFMGALPWAAAFAAAGLYLAWAFFPGWQNGPAANEADE